MPEKSPDEVVLKVRVRRDVVAAFAPAAAYARTTTAQLMRELIPYAVGMLDGPPAQWPEVLERIRQENLAKGRADAPAAAQARADAPPLITGEGYLNLKLVASLSAAEFNAYPEAERRAFMEQMLDGSPLVREQVPLHIKEALMELKD